MRSIDERRQNGPTNQTVRKEKRDERMVEKQITSKSLGKFCLSTRFSEVVLQLTSKLHGREEQC